MIVIKKLVPRFAKEFIKNTHQDFILNKAVREFISLRPDATLSEKLLTDLIYGWGNDSFSAEHEYLRAICEAARKCDKPILECGSGLSTLLLGIVAGRNNNEVWSFEHIGFWAQKVEAVLRKHRVNAVKMCVVEIKDYGDFAWYESPQNMPPQFSLVICDAPPGDTKGGRYGLLPVLGSHLKGATILLDDAQREGEKIALERWSQELKTNYELLGTRKPFARLVVPND